MLNISMTEFTPNSRTEAVPDVKGSIANQYAAFLRSSRAVRWRLARGQRTFRGKDADLWRLRE